MDRTGGWIAGLRGAEDNIGPAVALAQDGSLLDLKLCLDAGGNLVAHVIVDLVDGILALAVAQGFDEVVGEVAVLDVIAFLGLLANLARSNDGAAKALANAVDGFPRYRGLADLGGQMQAPASGGRAAVAGIKNHERAARLNPRANDFGDFHHGQRGREEMVLRLDLRVTRDDGIDVARVHLAG
jgi:hypothetical protein